MNKFIVALRNDQDQHWTFDNLESAKLFTKFILDDDAKIHTNGVIDSRGYADLILITEQTENGDWVQNWLAWKLLELRK